MTIIFVIPLVSAAIFEGLGKTFSNAKVFAIDNWNPNLLWALGGIVFVGFIAVRIKSHANAVSAQRMAVDQWEQGRRGRISGPIIGTSSRSQARQDRKLEENQLKVDRQIDRRIVALTKLEEKLNQEQINLDKGLYKLEGYEKRLLYWEERIGPYLDNLVDQIEYITRLTNGGGLENPESVRQSLYRLNRQFRIVVQKHSDILERFRLVIREEKRLIETKMAESKREKAVIEHEIIEERGEFRDVRKELREALDELKRLEDAGVSKKEIRTQKKKIRDIALRRKTEKRELRTEDKEDVILKKAVPIEQKILSRLEIQERAINQIELLERNLGRANIPPQMINIWKKMLRNQLKVIKKPVFRDINKLRDMDFKVEHLDEKARKLEEKRKYWSSQEERFSEKEEDTEREMAA